MRLDQKLLKKIAERLGKSEKYVREQISRRAAKAGIVSEAAQVVWGRELGIGTAAAHRRLDPHIQHQIATARSSGPSAPTSGVRREAHSRPRTRTADRPANQLGWAIDFLLSDPELNHRCGDLLKARKSHDRVVREATVIVDNRLKRLSGITSMNGGPLIGKVLHPDNGFLIVSNNPAERLGIFEIFKGVFSTFRNPSHHTLNDALTRDDALRFCGLADWMLKVLSGATRRTVTAVTGVAE